MFRYNNRFKGDILKYILIPCIEHSFEANEHLALIGTSPEPELDSDSNIVSVFMSKIIDTENPSTQSDSVRIYLLQLSSVFVQFAHEYIHDVNNKKQGTKLRRLMTFAWPCLLAKTCVDPVNKYNGLLLLSHIISKFAIHKRIVLQIFHSLLKAYQPEAKQLVREALDILTPTFPTRTDEGYITLSTWIKKILIEENHSTAQLAHICYIIVKYDTVFYFIRHSLINHLIISLQKISLSANSTPENRTLAIDLAEVILKWEAKRFSEYERFKLDELEQADSLLAKHPDLFKPFDKHVSDFIINFFIRISLIDSNSNAAINSSAANFQQQQHQIQQATQQTDILSRRCLNLFKLAISTDLFANADLKMDFIEKIMISLESTHFSNPLVSVLTANGQQPPQQQAQQQSQPNYSSITICLEIVTYLVESTTNKSKIQQILRSIQKGLSLCIISNNNRIVRSIGLLIEKLMSTLPIECFNYNPMLNNATSSSGNDSTQQSQQQHQQIQSQQQQQQQYDPIYLLFGQPEGNTFCLV